MKISNSRRGYLLALIVGWIVSRCFYFYYFGVRLDSSSLGSYLQYIDPVLLKTALWQSLLYLNNQPPGFNLFLGVVLQLFGSHAGWAFQIVYWGFGLGLAIALFFLLLRLGVFAQLAFLTTAWFCLSPITLLYENWLFYTYPITFLLVVSALFLHRYIVSERTADLVVFFSTMAIIVLTRGIFHFAWLLLVVFVLWFVRRRFHRQVALAAALPCLLVGALYLKNYVIFKTTLSGRVYQNVNFGMMVFGNLSEAVKKSMIDAGKVSELAQSNAYQWLDVAKYRRLLPAIKKWGIPILDQEVKSTGFPNWQSQVIAEFAQVYYRDAMAAEHQHPVAYFRAVVGSLGQYFKAADEALPYYDTPPSDLRQARMRQLLSVWHLLLAGRLPLAGFAGKVPLLNLVVFPVCLVFGCWYVGRRLHQLKNISDPVEKANAAVIIFMLYNIAYIAAVTILFSFADHSRYRFKVSAFYAALFGLLITSGWRSIRKRHSMIKR